MPTPALMTADELLSNPVPNARAELVRGRLIVREPAGYRHGVVAMRIQAWLYTFVSTNRLGDVVSAETGFTLFRAPDTVRAPDAAFVRNERRPALETGGFAELAPDLVVEVRSPDYRTGEICAKVADWLTAGTRLIWIIDPMRRIAIVHRTDGSITALTERDSLDGEEVLPGFSAPLRELLDG